MDNTASAIGVSDVLNLGYEFKPSAKNKLFIIKY